MNAFETFYRSLDYPGRVTVLVTIMLATTGLLRVLRHILGR